MKSQVDRRVAEYAARSNKLQLLSKEERIRRADYAHSPRYLFEAGTPRRRWLIPILGLILLTLIFSEGVHQWNKSQFAAPTAANSSPHVPS